MLTQGAAEKAKSSAGPVSAVDAVLEQINKGPKLSMLDKTKKDWGDFKEENKGLEDELDAYKKSSNQYLEKVSFCRELTTGNSSRNGILIWLCRLRGGPTCKRNHHARFSGYALMKGTSSFASRNAIRLQVGEMREVAESYMGGPRF